MADMRRENAFPLRLLKKDPEIEALRRKYLQGLEGSKDESVKSNKTKRTFSNLRYYFFLIGHQQPQDIQMLIKIASIIIL